MKKILILLILIVGVASAYVGWSYTNTKTKFSQFSQSARSAGLDSKITWSKDCKNWFDNKSSVKDFLALNRATSLGKYDFIKITTNTQPDQAGFDDYITVVDNDLSELFTYNVEANVLFLGGIVNNKLAIINSDAAAYLYDDQDYLPVKSEIEALALVAKNKKLPSANINQKDDKPVVYSIVENKFLSCTDEKCMTERVDSSINTTIPIVWNKASFLQNLDDLCSLIDRSDVMISKYNALDGQCIPAEQWDNFNQAIKLQKSNCRAYKYDIKPMIDQMVTQDF